MVKRISNFAKFWFRMDMAVFKTGNTYRRGCSLNEETKRKISLSKIGRVPWNFGMRGGHHSEEYKRKMSIVCGGTGNSIETTRRHHLRRKQLIAPIIVYFNRRFSGSHLHHMGYGMGIFIPADLHQSLKHSLLGDENLNQINELAFDWWRREVWEKPER